MGIWFLKNLKTIILSAGFGERLHPLTNVRPKPLLPVWGKPILFHIYKNLKKKGIYKFYINLHYKAGFMKKAIDEINKGDIKINIEEKIRGTGGGVKGFENYLKNDDYFIVHNGDSIIDFSLKKLIDNFKKNDALILLLLVKRKDNYSTLGINDNQDVLFGEKHGPFNFTGISIWRTELLNYLNKDYDDISKTIFENPRFKGKIKGLETKANWFEFTNPAKYYKYNIDYFKNINKNTNKFSIQNSVLGKNINIKQDTKIVNSILWDKITINRNCYISDCIVTDNVSIPEGETINNSIIINRKKNYKLYKLNLDL